MCSEKRQLGRLFLRRMLLIVSLAFLAGCTNTAMTKNQMVETRIAKQNRSSKTNEINEKIFNQVQPAPAATDPLLGSGDLLEMKVFEAPELVTQVRISSRGFITLPLLTDVEAAGLTARELEMKIEGLYRAKYIRDPHVSLFVQEHLSQKVTFVGQIKSPGTYELPARIKLLDALALAGGLTSKAGGTAQVRRVGKTMEDTGSYIVDLDRLINEGAAELNIPIHGGDIVFVEEGGMFYVDGAVRMTGAFPIKSTTTLEEAIMTAGGFLSYADSEDVILVRRNAENKREVKHLNLEIAKHGSYPIKDGDILVVGSTFWGRLSSGSGFSFGIPFIGGMSYSNPQRYR
ncbi:MAG: SLBB domain-containing protein [Deltaproteobacteria bacterium]|nr:SLBB domain-containing protein [Deltaproteobacteria bacterium]